jgi:hypothetical protein
MMGGTVSFQFGFGFAHGLLDFLGAAAAAARMALSFLASCCPVFTTSMAQPGSNFSG